MLITSASPVACSERSRYQCSFTRETPIGSDYASANRSRPGERRGGGPCSPSPDTGSSMAPCIGSRHPPLTNLMMTPRSMFPVLPGRSHCLATPQAASRITSEPPALWPWAMQWQRSTCLLERQALGWLPLPSIERPQYDHYRCSTNWTSRGHCRDTVSRSRIVSLRRWRTCVDPDDHPFGASSVPISTLQRALSRPRYPTNGVLRSVPRRSWASAHGLAAIARRAVSEESSDAWRSLPWVDRARLGEE
jgi:hypothetical protein